jgi:hypothetical protein
MIFSVPPFFGEVLFPMAVACEKTFCLEDVTNNNTFVFLSKSKLPLKKQPQVFVSFETTLFQTFSPEFCLISRKGSQSDMSLCEHITMNGTSKLLFACSVHS